MAIIHDITPVGNKVRYTKYDSEDEVFFGKEFVYDINDNNVKQMAEDINLKYVGPLTISEGDYIFTPISINEEDIEYSDYIYKSDIETGVSKKLFKREFSDLTHYSDDSYIEGNIISGDEKYMFLKGQNQEEAYIKYIDKSEIGTGNLMWKTLFELEEKYLDTAVSK